MEMMAAQECREVARVADAARQEADRANQAERDRTLASLIVREPQAFT